jgi:hypothetical protein
MLVYRCNRLASLLSDFFLGGYLDALVLQADALALWSSFILRDIPLTFVLFWLALYVW